MTIQEFAKGYNQFEELGTWQSYKVTHATTHGVKGKIGLPQFVLEKNGEFKWADYDQIFDIMDVFYPTDEEEEN